MKKAWISQAIVMASLAAGLLAWIAITNSTTTLASFEQQLSDSLRPTGLRYLEYKIEDADQVALPPAFRIREIFALWPRPNLPSQSAEAVVHYTFESESSRRRIECLVRCFHGKVVRIIVRYPSAARAEARALAKVLRQSSGGVVTSLNVTD